MAESLEKVKVGFASKIVNQERKIIDVYVHQIKALKEKFDREFQDKVKK